MNTGTGKKTYICTGTCGAHITEEEYNNGLVACGTEGCTMKGHPFVEETEAMHGSHPVVEEVVETTQTVVTPKDDEDDVIINNG